MVGGRDPERREESHAAGPGQSPDDSGPGQSEPVLPEMSRLDGGELLVLRVIGQGRHKIIYEARDPEHPDETVAVQVQRDTQNLPSYNSGSDAIRLLQQNLTWLLQSEEIDPEQVIRICDQLINLNERDEVAYFNRGTMRMMVGNPAGAVLDLAAAARLAPNDPANWMQLSAAALRAGEPDLALRAANQAASVDVGAVASYLASVPDVRSQLGRLMSEQTADGIGVSSALIEAFVQIDGAPQLAQLSDAGSDLSAAIPWPTSADELHLPDAPLLPAGTFLRISESAVPSAHIMSFSAGYVLALMHAYGLVHGDFYPSNFVFQVDSGWTLALDSSGGRPADFSALHAAYDFMAPALTLDAESLSAMLIGYGKALSVRGHSSSFQPEEVFALLGVDVDYMVRVEPYPGMAAQLARCLDLRISGGAAPSVSVQCPQDGDLEHWLLAQPRLIGALALATTFLHYDAAALWRCLAERLEPTASSVGIFAAQMARESGLPGPAAPVADLEPEQEIARTLIRAAAEVGGALGMVRTASAEWPVGRIEGAFPLAKWVRNFLHSRDTDGGIRTNRVIDDTLELVDAIAIAWDQDPERRWLSQATAQISQQLLNSFASEQLVDERRELAMTARHARLSWLASPSLQRTFSAEVAPYAIDRLRTLLNLFTRTIPPRTPGEPIAKSEIQWSLAWRGLALTSELLRTYPDDSVTSEAESQFIIVEFVKLYHEFLRRYALALMAAFDARLMVEGDCFAKGFAQITEEFGVVDGILEGARSHEDVVRFRWAAIEQLRTRLRRSRRRSFLFDNRLGSLIGNG